MLGLILKVAGAATAAGFAAGIFASAKAGKTKDKVKEKFSNVKTHLVEVQIPKGRSIEECQIHVLVPVDE
jgi:hypothetical protein